ncbi:MAG: PhnD/SsuA/transferrin family substrate-binding protein [Chloroflexota bacterium]
MKHNRPALKLLITFLVVVPTGLMLAACQPAPLPVEVTRVVERDVTVLAPTQPPSSPLPTLAPVINIVTETAVIEVTPPPLGTDERPVQLLFPPVANTAVIMQRGEALAQALEAATGVNFVVGIADDEEKVVDLLCSAPGDTIAFISAAAYTIARERCDSQAVLVARGSDELAWETGMIVTSAGSGIGSLDDLAGQRWVVSDTGTLANELYFRALMAEAGVTPGEIINTPEDTTALLALRNGEADFATAVFVPPIMPFDGIWQYGETDPEVWRVLGISPTRSPIGYVVVAGEPAGGGYRLRDARSRLFDTTPDIFDVTRILTLGAPIPRETVVLGADFPFGLARQTLATLVDFAASDACQSSLCSADLYSWTGLEPAEDSDYDPIRFITNTLDLDAADLWAAMD